VERDGRRVKLPKAEVFAARSRRAAAVARQRPRREREQQARQHAAAFADFMRAEGGSCCQAARRLCLSPRTLSEWCCSQRKSEKACDPRGRPCKESPFQIRLGVVEFLRDTGPGIGIPTLRATFPKVPPCELTDLRLDYRDIPAFRGRAECAECAGRLSSVPIARLRIDQRVSGAVGWHALRL
jgi:hypothetical protein